MRVTRPISARAGGAVERDRSPAVAVRECGRQSQHEPAHRGEHLDADLEQFKPQGRDLRPRPGGAVGGEPQFLQQHVGGRGQEHTELVGEEARAAGAVEGDVEELFDAVLGVAPLAVRVLVDPPGLALEASRSYSRSVGNAKASAW